VVDATNGADLVRTGSEDEHGEEEAHAEEDEHGEEDPHFWLDPDRMAAVAEQVADALAEADPAREEDYRANLRTLEDDLDSLHTDLKEGLSDCERDVVVVSHDAFGYMAVRYGLDFHAIAGLSPDAEPSPAHLRELQDLIRAEGVTTVFSERLASAKMARTLSSDLGLETGVLDPIEGLSDETAEEDYLSLMRQNLRTLQEANQCR
jgi:zinc transport system substrate-binding protein